MNEIKLGREIIFSKLGKQVMYYVYYLSSSSYQYFQTENDRSQYIANHKLIINLKTENYA
mgnify:FL=1|jgi:hypothetical protein